MNFNNVIVIFLHLVILFEIVSTYRHKSWKPYKSRSSSSRHKKTHSLTQSKVILPSGKNFYITNPRIKKEWKCSDKPKLITLKPTGAMGKREYTMVKNEMEFSWGKGKGTVFKGHKIIKIEKVENACLWEKYQHRRREIAPEAKNSDENLFFHGSPAVSDMINSGFDERYAKTSGWFGAGVYFASHAAKSHDYTKPQKGGIREMLLCRVTMGKSYHARPGMRFSHAPVGYHSVKGQVTMPEFIIYRGEQAYPEYKITYK